MFSFKQLLRMLALRRRCENLPVCCLFLHLSKKPFGKDPHPAGCSGLQETLLFVPPRRSQQEGAQLQDWVLIYLLL